MMRVLVLNAGSSSLKFGLFRPGSAEDGDAAPVLSGIVDRIGGDATLRVRDSAGVILAERAVHGAGDHRAALGAALSAVAAVDDSPIAAVGHRVVHGGPDFAEPVAVTPEILEGLRALVPFAPLHQPHNLAGIEAAQAAFPDAYQVACFDTAFHRGHPFAVDAFALPRRYHAAGVRRYGFHGLNYAHVAGWLAAREPALHAGRVIVAHLGNGASMCGIKAGRSVASTMGFTALDGLPMGTRSGQIDPGVLLYLMESEGMDSAALTDLLYKRSGLLGISGLSGDMRVLLASDAPEAAQAVDLFCHRIRHETGALAADLGGCDALIFTGGIGEHAAQVRARVCDRLDWLGLGIDPQKNAAGNSDITASQATARVLIVPANEEAEIARAALALARQ